MNESAATSGADGDSFEFWPLVAAIGALFAAGCIGSYSPLAIVPIAFLASIAAIVSLVRGVGSGWRKKWRKAASLLVLPVAIAATLSAPRVVLGPFFALGDYLHVLAGRPFYEAELAKEARYGRFHVFDWGGWGGSNTFLIYDENDEIALPPGKREWGAVAGGIASICAGRVIHISGHYYRCND